MNSDPMERERRTSEASGGGHSGQISRGSLKPWLHSLRDPAFLIILAIGTAIRFIGLEQQSFWYDEIHSVDLASGAPTGDILTPLLTVHGPLYLLLLRGWMVLVGTGEGAIRLLSAMIGSAGLVLFYKIVLRFAGRNVAIVALALLAVSPFHLWYSQEARNYVLLVDMGLLAVAAIVTEVESATKRSFVAAFAALCAACLCNLSGFFLLPLYGIYSLTVRRRTQYPLWRMTAIALLVVIALWPWVIRGAHSTGQMSLGRPAGEDIRIAVKGESPPGLLSIPYALYNFSLGMSVGPSVYEMKIGRARSVVPDLWWLIPAAGLFVTVSLRGVLKAPRSIRELTILWVAVPILMMVAMASLNLKAPNSRYAILALPPYLMAISMGIVSVRSRTTKGLVFAAVVLLMAYSDYQYFTNSRYWRPDTRAAGKLIHEEAQDGDIVIIYALGYPVKYYLRNGFDVARPAHRVFVDEESMMRWLEENVAGKKRIWVVQCNAWWVDREDRFLHLCQRIMKQIGEWHFTKVPVYLLENSGDWEKSDHGSPLEQQSQDR